MHCLRFNLTISTEDYLAYYAGHAKSISVTCHDGRRIEFPAEHMRQFVLHDGISGQFEICFNVKNRFESIRQII